MAFKVVDVCSFMGVDYETYHYLVVAKIRERLEVSKQHSKTLKERIKKCIRLKSQTCLELWKT
jgi:hypothetical protein